MRFGAAAAAPGVEVLARRPPIITATRAVSIPFSGATLGAAVRVLAALFVEAAPPLACTKSADANDDGRLELVDPLFVLNFLFQNGRAPSAPLAACATDPTPDGLGCEDYPACE